LEEVHLLQQGTSKRKVLPLFVSTEKPLVPLILCMDLGFEENAHLGSIGVSLQGSQNLVEDMIFGRITIVNHNRTTPNTQSTRVKSD
jgi:hypothetical protein